jgi:opacity protein-like surface antigen
MSSYGALLALVLLSAQASAQTFEVGGLFGYTTEGGLEPVARELDGYAIGGGFTWQGQFDYFVTPHLGFEASWAQREGALTLKAMSQTGELFEIDAGQLLGSVVYQWRQQGAKVRPFVFGGLGATFFRADDIPSEKKLAWAVGGGVKITLHPKLGIKLQAKYNPTVLNDESSEFCDPFGFCASSVSSFELLSGVVFRF